MALVVRENEYEATSSQGTDESTAQRVFYVESDDASDVSTVDAENASGIPDIGDAHPDAATRIVISVNSAHVSGRKDRCKVTVNYSSGFDAFLVTDPLTDDPEWELQTQEYEEEYYIDKSDTPARAVLTNTKPIMPRPKRTAVSYVLVIRKNVAVDYAIATTMSTYQNTVNSDTVTHTDSGISFTEGKGHLIIELSEIQNRNVYEYRVLTLKIAITKDSHRQTYEMRDTEQLTTANTPPLQPIFSDDNAGREVAFPYPLQENGLKAATASTAPFTKTLKPYTEVAMNTFINA